VIFRSKTNHIPGKNEHILLPLINCFRVRRWKCLTDTGFQMAVRGLPVHKAQKAPQPFRICKGKVVLVLRHEGVWGSGCIHPRFLDLATSWRWVVSFTPQPLYPRRKRRRHPLDRRLGGPKSRSGRRGEVKILDPTGTRTPTPWSSSP
jgi:hypothetical protein